MEKPGLTKIDTALYKGLGILLIAFHNFLHWIQPSPGENEFDFFTTRVWKYIDATAASPLESINLFISYFGHFGVQIFIFISAYGLAISYGNKRPNWINFILQRLKKLYPAFLSAIVIFLIWTIFKSGIPDTNFFKSLGLKLIFINSFYPWGALSLNGPWWFYAMIVQLYVIFPIMYKAIKRFGFKAFLFFTILSYTLIYTYQAHFLKQHIYLMSSFIGHLPEFALGIYLALNPHRLKIHWGVNIFAALLFIGGNFIEILYPFTFLSITILFIALGNVWFTKLNNQGKLFKLLTYYGGISMYLFSIHGFFRPPFCAMANKLSSPLTTLVVALAFVLFSTAMVYAQKQIIEYGHSISQKFRQIFIWINKKFHMSAFESMGKFFISFAVVLFLLRCYEHLNMTGNLHYLFSALWYDLILVAVLISILFIPHRLLTIRFPKIANGFTGTLLGIVLIFHTGLIEYYFNTQVPLDHVIYQYNTKEMMDIISSSTSLNILTWLPFIGSVAIFILSYILLKKRKLNDSFIIFLLLLSLSIFASVKGSRYIPRSKQYENEKNLFLVANKTTYLINRCSVHKQKKVISFNILPDQIRKESEKYWKQNPQHQYIDATHPFIHSNVTQNTLKPFFSFNKSKSPNIVFLIVESLSGSFFGDRGYQGNFTPFLDSLSKKGLYWPNGLSTAERTFEVLPSILASVPFGEAGFSHFHNRIPDHQSLITLLQKAGYHSAFFYGGKPSFNGMEAFLNKSNIDYIYYNQDTTISTDSSNEHNNWGLEDDQLFSKTFPILKTFPENRPMLNVYLTLSIHRPFTPPHLKTWQKRFLSRNEKLNISDKQKAINRKSIDEFATVMYTDYTIGQFFELYKKRADYDNTIFIITGDHRIGTIPRNSAIDVYHVPIIIYSPLLNSSRTFESLASHNDIAPTLHTLLAEEYKLPKYTETAWVGNSMDTLSHFSSNLRMPFIRNNRSIIDYIDGEYYISRDNLYKITPNMKPIKVDDESKLAELKGKLDTYKNVNQFCYKNNMLLSDALLKEVRNNEQLLFSINTSFEQSSSLNNQYPVSDNQAFEGEKSVLVNSKTTYGTIMPNIPLSKNFTSFEADYEFYYQTSIEEQKKIPSLVLSIFNKEKRGITWSNTYYDKSEQIARNGQIWNKTNGRIHIELTDKKETTKEGMLKFYLWNRSNQDFYYDNLKLTIRGISAQ